MKAFHSDPRIKEKYIARIAAHEAADEIVKGQYWRDGKGCAVGCTIHGSDHQSYETELGIPRIIARLEDGIFEALPNELAQTWPRRFLETINPDTDLSMIWTEFAIWLMDDPKYGVIQFAKTDQQRKAIQSVADLYRLKLSGADIRINDWLSARNAAADAAAYAAYAAADAAAYAAYAAADAKRAEWRIAQSEKLLELLRAAK